MAYYKADEKHLLISEQVHIALSDDVLEKIHLCRRRDLDPEAADILATDPDERVRVELAAFCRDREVLVWMAKKDSSKKVRKLAGKRRYLRFRK